MNPSRSLKSGGQKASHLIMILSLVVRIWVNFNTWFSPEEETHAWINLEAINSRKADKEALLSKLLWLN